jgi:hypothetical protein
MQASHTDSLDIKSAELISQSYKQVSHPVCGALPDWKIHQMLLPQAVVLDDL